MGEKDDSSRQCQHVTREGDYNGEGGLSNFLETRCKLITDRGKTLCPRHEMEEKIERERNRWT